MSESVKKIAFGNVNDNDESLKGKSGSVKFGLNSGKIVSIAYNPNAGENGSAADAVDIKIAIGEREMNHRVYDITRVYDSKGDQITDETSDEYIKRYNEEAVQNMAVIVHSVKAAGVTQAQLDVALATPKASFVEWMKAVTALVSPAMIGNSIDVFLEYQWKISENQNRTFLQLPKNMKGGRFMTPSIAPVGSWEEERQWTETKENGQVDSHEGLRYVDKAGNVHPFTRSQNFMESPKANQQSDQDEASGPARPVAGVSNSEGQKKSTW